MFAVAEALTLPGAGFTGRTERLSHSTACAPWQDEADTEDEHADGNCMFVPGSRSFSDNIIKESGNRSANFRSVPGFHSPNPVIGFHADEYKINA